MTIEHAPDVPYRGRPPRSVEARWVFGGLLLFSIALYLALLWAPRADGQLIGSDGAYYYVYARSLIIDGDLDFRNEYARYRLPAASWSATPTGRAPNRFAIGPAIFWIPFFLVAHALAKIGSAFGLAVVPDGYGYLYQASISLGSILYGACGFWLAYACGRRMFSETATLSAVILLWLASNAFYYMVFEPSMAHMVSLFSVALLFTIWFTRFREAAPPNMRWGALIGVAGGVVLLVRLQDAPLLILPYGSVLLRAVLAWRAADREGARQWLGLGFLAAAMTLVVLIPQLLVWEILYGSWAVSPYLIERSPAFHWLRPQLAGVLFSTFHGLFSWHPIYLFALLGVLFILARDRFLAFGLLIALAADVYLVAAWWAWWQGDSFGGRMFLNATWIWVFGFAALLDWLRARRGFAAAVGLGALLIAWNGLSLIQYRLGFVPMGEPLTWKEMTVDRVMLPWRLLQRDGAASQAPRVSSPFGLKQYYRGSMVYACLVEPLRESSPSPSIRTFTTESFVPLAKSG